MHYQRLRPRVAKKTQTGFNSMEFKNICDYVDPASQQGKQEPEGNRKTGLFLGMPYRDERIKCEGYLANFARRPPADRPFLCVSGDTNDSYIDIGRSRFQDASDYRVDTPGYITQRVRRVNDADAHFARLRHCGVSSQLQLLFPTR
jgi:hypothetical protein